MIMEPCVALKRNICIYLIVYINFYSFTDLSGGSASQRGDFVCCCFFFNAFPQRLLPKQKHSQTWGELLHIQLGGGVCGLGVLPPSNPLPAGFGVTLRPSPPALWPVFRCDCSDGGAQCILDVLIKRHC